MNKLLAVLLLFVTLIILTYAQTPRDGWIRCEGNITRDCAADPSENC